MRKRTPSPVPRDVAAALDTLGIDYVIAGDEAKALCPAHEDHSPSWSVNLTTGKHNCFSCGFGGSFQLLVSVVQDASYSAAGTWIRERKVRDAAVGVEVGPAPAKRRRVVTEADMYRFDYPPEWACEARGFSHGTARRCDVLWDHDNAYWITPIRDPYSCALWGWQEKAEDGRHFKNVPRDVEKSRALFGFQSLAPGGTAVLVESPLDVARLRFAGIMGAVSSYGVHVSDEQISLLVDRCSEVVLALDNDDAGRRESERLTAELPGRITVRVFNYGNVVTRRAVDIHGELDGRDPGDLGRADLLWGNENATPAWRTRFA